MILTPVAPDRLRRALLRFGAQLKTGTGRQVFHRLARPAQAARARGNSAALHHRTALRIARTIGMGRQAGPPRSGFSWDGRSLRSDTEAYVLLHEVAHYQLAMPLRRRCRDFALGPGPETGERAAAERAVLVSGIDREREEALASLLGILWEMSLGQPALASWLDQNWLEGSNGAAARHFETMLAALRRDRFIDAAGQPLRRLRRKSKRSA
jgi:hypothetical protein